MNKSILRHEFRSMKWILLLSAIISSFLTLVFSLNLNGNYSNMFLYGHYINEAIIKDALRDVHFYTLILFSLLAAIQVFLQFRAEKDSEVVRFLKSLPIKREEFFKVKLLTGLLNLSIGFILLGIGVLLVRGANMFWIVDSYKISIVSKPFIILDSPANTLKELFLIYLIIVTFYTFLFMIQYTFTNVIGGIVAACLIWMAPLFIVNVGVLFIGKIGNFLIYKSEVLNKIIDKSYWLMPWSYPLNRDIFSVNQGNLGTLIVRESIISNFNIKMLIVLGLIVVNIFIAYRFVKRSMVEDENKVIPFASCRLIFNIGVTICSGLLLFFILSLVLGLEVSALGLIIEFLIGATVGYVISKKISSVGL